MTDQAVKFADGEADAVPHSAGQSARYRRGQLGRGDGQINAVVIDAGAVDRGRPRPGAGRLEDEEAIPLIDGQGHGHGQSLGDKPGEPGHSRDHRSHDSCRYADRMTTRGSSTGRTPAEPQRNQWARARRSHTRTGGGYTARASDVHGGTPRYSPVKPIRGDTRHSLPARVRLRRLSPPGGAPKTDQARPHSGSSRGPGTRDRPQARTAPVY